MRFEWGYKGSESADDAFKVRLEVFVSEQGFSAEAELDDTDNTALQLTGYDNANRAVCAARLFSEHSSIWHAGRIAVIKEMRGSGAGRLIMQSIAEKAHELGAQQIVLGAQYDKAGFYEKCGYVKTGKEFLDEGYPHVEMSLRL